jgi:hypothetical protein
MFTGVLTKTSQIGADRRAGVTADAADIPRFSSDSPYNCIAPDRLPYHDFNNLDGNQGRP